MEMKKEVKEIVRPMQHETRPKNPPKKSGDLIRIDMYDLDAPPLVRVADIHAALAVADDGRVAELAAAVGRDAVELSREPRGRRPVLQAQQLLPCLALVE